MKINRYLTNICCKDLTLSKQFYTQYFDFEIMFDSDWFVQLTSQNSNTELGLIDINSPLILEEYRNQPTGFYQTYIVDDVDLFADSLEDSVKILQAAEDTEYGQRRMLVQAPEGSLIDISSLMK